MRQPEYPIESLILNRWSPRSISGEAVSDKKLMPLFEAARWAPSSYMLNHGICSLQKEKQRIKNSCLCLKRLDGHPLHIMLNHGICSLQKEKQRTGSLYLSSSANLKRARENPHLL